MKCLPTFHPTFVRRSKKKKERHLSNCKRLVHPHLLSARVLPFATLCGGYREHENNGVQFGKSCCPRTAAVVEREIFPLVVTSAGLHLASRSVGRTFCMREQRASVSPSQLSYVFLLVRFHEFLSGRQAYGCRAHGCHSVQEL